MSGPHPAVAAVRSAVRTALAEAEPGDVVLAACSGGADSWALAAALAFEAPRLAVRAGAVVVDHALQPGTAARSADLGDRLRAAGLEPVRVVAVDVGRVGGPEAAARTARYAALDAVATEERAALVLLGHTRDDQAETVLLGLARGSGARSLAGMPRASGRYRRPLLALPRATTHDACKALGILTWADPHNDDPAYARVRVRQAALPALERSLGPGVAAALARSADLLRDDAAALDAWAAEAEASATDPDGGLAVDVLRALPTAVRRRVLRRAALAAGCPPGTLAAVHVDAVDALLTDWHGQGPLDLPGGVSAARARERLTLATRP